MCSAHMSKPVNLRVIVYTYLLQLSTGWNDLISIDPVFCTQSQELTGRDDARFDCLSARHHPPSMKFWNAINTRVIT